MFKRKFSALLVLISILVSTVSFASNNIEQDTENTPLTTHDEIIVLADEVEEEVNNYLETQGTNIIEVLKDMKKDYEEQIAVETDFEKLKYLEVLSEQIDKDIELMESQQIPTKMTKANTRSIKYDTTLISCKSYFYAKAYTLSHELISKYQVNTSSRVIYYPENTGGLYRTSVIESFRERQRFTSGHDIFEGGSTRNEKDAHYAINKFSYTQDAYDITINDTYDFDYGDKDSYNDIVQAAVNILAEAEKDGYFIPVKLRIEL